MHGATGRGPPFDLAVPPGGYAWWYLDASSDDGRHGLTLIAFVGSVFSPFYAGARRRHGTADALAHCALNVALYGDVRRWAMTERDAGAVRRSASEFQIGPSALRWRDGALEIDVREITVPWPSRLLGRVRVTPQTAADGRYDLDAAGRHRWGPIAPSARVELDFDAPALRWAGHGYLDSNTGDEPLEAAFRSWQWSRELRPDGSTRVLYDVERRDGSALALGLDFDRAGDVTPCDPPPSCALPLTGWRIGRHTRLGTAARNLRVVEDTPFYARSMTLPVVPGATQVVHESLSLERFAQPWVQTLLPFRMGRRRSRRRA